MALARADLESLLRTRHLDRTLTTAITAPDPADDTAVAPTGVTALDAYLGGGFPRGQLSEVIGPRSSGRTSVLRGAMAAAAARGELVALVDALDTFDVESAAAAGIDLDRVLWIRGHVVTNPGLCRDLNQRAVEQAIRAFALVLQAGNFGLAVFDAADAPADAVRRLPFTTWLRLHRMIEGTQTACVLVGSETMARSSAGVTVRLGMKEGRGQRAEGRAPTAESGAMPGVRFGARVFEGFDVTATAIRARVRPSSDAAAIFRTVCHG
jgi:recombination protein RecA